VLDIFWDDDRQCFHHYQTKAGNTP